MDTGDMQATLNRLHRQQANDEFSDHRYALLFKPGDYQLDINVDYYVQAAGLGRRPGDTRIKGAVQSRSSTTRNRVTIMFWRSAENFQVTPPWLRRNYWAVSQAAPFRRMHIKGGLRLDLGSWASGGFLANSVVEGSAGLTSGQQWFTRNSELGAWTGGNWNRTFVGTTGTPEENWPRTPTTVIDQTPVIRDKPFLVIDDAGRFAVFKPAMARNTRGVTWRGAGETGQTIPIDDFHIAFPDADTADSINSALAHGKHLLLTPGIYTLDQPIHIRRADTLLMGMGLATLVPRTGRAVLVTDDVPGITISALMVDAGLEHSPVLIQIGDDASGGDHRQNPTVLHDVFCRVGGAIAGSADACLVVNSNDVIIDHTWLWRADHGTGARWNLNRSNHGLVVNGDDVTIYGLFNEHFQQYQTLWNGERGRVYFYQSEIPYDPPSHKAWRPGATGGYASYKVADHVREHQAYGLGIYSFFDVRQQEEPVRLRSAIEAPETPGVRIHHVSTFSGRTGGIDYPLNLQGEATNVGELRLFDGINPKEDR
ncbi:MAG: adenylyl cyclase [Xanthomonadales bacterium]|nr:adenylyl cyclase [Xanthomonadales bacterium]